MPLLVVTNVLQVVPFALVPVLLLLFPDGELPLGRMRWVARALVVLVLLDSAAYALRGFAAHLRDEVDVERLDAELRRTVDAALAPASSRLWFPPDGAH